MDHKLGLWMYCIIENRGTQPVDCFGIHGTSRVFMMASNGPFTAVVSQEPMKKYPLVRDYLMAHQRVNETVMQNQPVLPVRFCTMAYDEPQITHDVLNRKADEFQKKLGEIKGKEECGLRVRWKDLDRVFRELGETNPKILEKKQKLLSLSESQRRTELIDMGHLVQAAIQEKNEKMATALIEELGPLAILSKRNPTLGDAMILNAAFLVNQQRQPSFDARVQSLGERYDSLLQFKYVGPVPPFNFVEIVIKWEERPADVSSEVKNVSVG